MRYALAILLACGVAEAKRGLPSARVIKIEVAGDAVLATAAIGSDQGIARTMACKLVDDRGKVAAADCWILRVDRRTTIVKTRATVDQLHVLRVQFDAK